MSYTEYSQVPWFRKGLFVGLIWLVLMPAGLILMWSGDVYYNRKVEGKLQTQTALHKVAMTLITIMLIVSYIKRNQ